MRKLEFRWNRQSGLTVELLEDQLAVQTASDLAQQG
jgi:hypothetical protein